MTETGPAVPADFLTPVTGLLADLGRRRLPIRVTPLADETVPSWLEHAARKLHIAPVTLAKHIGLSLTRAHLGTVTASEIETVEDLARLSPGTLPPPRQPYASYWAAPSMRVAYCPACLDERNGRWRMSWLLPWTFACSSHQVELVDTCPECAQPPRVPDRPFLELMTIPSTCHRLAPDDTRLGRLAPRCLGQLARASASPASATLLTAQSWVDELFSPDGLVKPVTGQVRLTGLDVPVPWAVRDLLAVSLLLDGYALPDRLLELPDDVQEQISELPGATAMTADGLIRLHEVASAASLDEAVQRWRALGQRPPTLTELQTRIPGRPSPWLQALVLRGERTSMGPRRRLAHRADTARPLLALEHFSHPTGGPDWPLVADSGLGAPVFLDPSHVPATLWSSATTQILGDYAHTRRYDSLIDLRAVLSMSALLVGRHRTWGLAAQRLGLPEQSVLDASRLLRGLKQDGLLDLVLEDLQDLVDFLHDQPINICYWRRRRLFSSVPKFTAKLERRVWTALGAGPWAKGRWSRHGHLEVRLAELLTGSDHLHLSLPPDVRISYRALRKKEPDLDLALEPLGERLLLRNRLNEPLTAAPNRRPDGQWHAGERWERHLSGWNEPSYVWRDSSRSLTTGGGRGANPDVDLLGAIAFDAAARERASLVLAAVAEQNASAAARTHGVKPAVVLTALSWFEDNFSFAVFERRKHAGAIALTVEGRRALLAVRRLLASAPAA